MAKNLVSQPPLNTPIVDKSGLPSRVFAIWMRDIYRRTAYKGGNAIDENKAEVDKELVDVNATLQETIVQVNVNIEGISVNSSNIIVNAENLTVHEELEEAHGSNGNVVGFNDLSDEAIVGLVKRMALLADAVDSVVSVVTPDASAAPATYSQVHSQELVDLSNANKIAINALVTDFNNAVTVLNTLIANSKVSGQMTT